MSKTRIIFTTLLVMLFAGCTTDPQPTTINPEKTLETRTTTSPKTVIKSETTLPIATNDEIMTVTGGFFYNLQPDTSVAPYRLSALNRVCFEPAQLETLNEGNMFCFTNTQESLTLFGYQSSDKNCDFSTGSATIKIRNLTDKHLRYSKGDPCVEKGTCDFNEAELIEVIDPQQPTPRCRAYSSP